MSCNERVRSRNSRKVAAKFTDIGRPKNRKKWAKWRERVQRAREAQR